MAYFLMDTGESMNPVNGQGFGTSDTAEAALFKTEKEAVDFAKYCVEEYGGNSKNWNLKYTVTPLRK